MGIASQVNDNGKLSPAELHVYRNNKYTNTITMNNFNFIFLIFKQFFIQERADPDWVNISIKPFQHTSRFFSQNFSTLFDFSQKWTYSIATNSHHTKFTPHQIYTAPNLHHTKFTPHQIYTAPNLHRPNLNRTKFTAHQIYTAPNLHRTKFTPYQIYTTPNLHHIEWYRFKLKETLTLYCFSSFSFSFFGSHNLSYSNEHTHL